MNLCVKKMQQYLCWLVENKPSRKISGRGWGNTDNDIYILKLQLRAYGKS
jgi:hypothetical protein